MAEMAGALEEVPVFLGVAKYRFTRPGLEDLKRAADVFLSTADLGAIDDEQRVSLHTRLMFLIGELLNERHGGHWTVEYNPASDFFGRYIVAGFRTDPDALVDPAETAHSLLIEEPPRHLLKTVDRLSASIDDRFES